MSEYFTQILTEFFLVHDVNPQLNSMTELVNGKKLKERTFKMEKGKKDKGRKVTIRTIMAGKENLKWINENINESKCIGMHGENNEKGKWKSHEKVTVEQEFVELGICVLLFIINYILEKSPWMCKEWKVNCYIMKEEGYFLNKAKIL